MFNFLKRRVNPESVIFCYINNINDIIIFIIYRKYIYIYFNQT